MTGVQTCALPICFPVTILQENLYSKDALKEIFDNARKICGKLPLAANILYAINDYGRVVRDACEAGANIIITGAGIPTNMPEFTKDFPDVALVPIVSSARALRLICKKWQRYNKIPDAVIVEGPLSGGHQGFKYEDCYKEEFQLENIVTPVIEEAKNWGNIPVIAAGGIWDKKDIDKLINYRDWETDRKSTRLNSSHRSLSRMPSSA